MSTQAQARPDLSALNCEARINIAVSETQGAVWAYSGVSDGPWMLTEREAADMDAWAALLWPDGSWKNDEAPEYTSDPATWGALMEKECTGWESGRINGRTQHRVRWDTHNGRAYKSGPWADSLPWAVALGVLKKYGVEVPS